MAIGGVPNPNAPPPKLIDAVKSMLALAMDKRFLVLTPQCAWTGVSIAYFSGNLVEMM
jgi:hypothetical protein